MCSDKAGAYRHCGRTLKQHLWHSTKKLHKKLGGRRECVLGHHCILAFKERRCKLGVQKNYVQRNENYTVKTMQYCGEESIGNKPLGRAELRRRKVLTPQRKVVLRTGENIISILRRHLCKTAIGMWCTQRYVQLILTKK